MKKNQRLKIDLAILAGFALSASFGLVAMPAQAYATDVSTVNNEQNTSAHAVVLSDETMPHDSNALSDQPGQRQVIGETLLADQTDDRNDQQEQDQLLNNQAHVLNDETISALTNINNAAQVDEKPKVNHLKGIKFLDSSGKKADHLVAKKQYKIVVEGARESDGFSYNFVYKVGNTWENWSSTIKRTGRAQTASYELFTPPTAGEYEFFVDVIYQDKRVHQLTSYKQVEPGFGARVVVSDPDKRDNTYRAGDIITISADTSTIHGPSEQKDLRYNFVVKQGDDWSNWSSTLKGTVDPQYRDYAKSNIKRVNLDKPGIYTFFLDVIDSSGTVLNSSAYEIKVKDRIEIKVGYQTSGKKNPRSVSFGSPLEAHVEVLTHGSIHDIKYNWVWSANSWDANKWSSTLKDTGTYTAKNSIRYDSFDLGTYNLFVDVVYQGQVMTFDVARGIKIVSSHGLKDMGITSEKRENGKTTRVTLKPVFTGVGKGLSYSYNFLYKAGGYESSWNSVTWDSVIKSTGKAISKSEYSFDLPFGLYLFAVDVIARNPQTGSSESQSFTQDAIVGSGYVAELVHDSTEATPKQKPFHTAIKKVAGAQNGQLQFNWVHRKDGGWDVWSSTLKETKRYTDKMTNDTRVKLSGVYDFFLDIIDGGTQNKHAQNISVNYATKRFTRGWDASVQYEQAVFKRPGNNVWAGVTYTGYNTDGLRTNWVWDRDNWSDWGSTLKGVSTASQYARADVNKQHHFAPNTSGMYRYYVDVIDSDGEKLSLPGSHIYVTYTPEENRQRYLQFARGEYDRNDPYWAATRRYENALVNSGRQLYIKTGLWCNTYVWYVGYQTNLLGAAADGYRVADPGVSYNWYKDRGQLYSTPQPGDTAFFYYIQLRSGQRATHSGIVNRVLGDGRFEILEGNMGGRSIRKHVYSVNFKNLVGFGRPQW